MYQGHNGLTVIFPFKDSIQLSLKVHAFFLFQNSLRNLNHGQYDLTYIVHLENIELFSKARVGNSNQDKIRFISFHRKLIFAT